ncbi:MAG: helix-hairpin-helix domain-containing protein [Bacteroidota bacterium]
MKQFIRDYFIFNRRERKGVIFLLCIILLLIGYLGFSTHFFTPEKRDFSEIDRIAASFDQHRGQDTADTVHPYDRPDYRPPLATGKSGPQRFLFDPNLLDDAGWKALGLSGGQLAVIRNYQKKGGRFRKKEDLKKIYVISESLYVSLEPYISIPADTAATGLSVKNVPAAIELNAADSAALVKLKGIGPVISRGIIRYRSMLGGYVSKEQLREVYGMKEETYESLKDNFTLDLSLVKKLNINTATLDELKKHPYIKHNLANLIVNYRQLHGSYGSVEDMRKLDLVNEELYVKLAPYLSVE